jgi:hypothetical protein
VAGVHHRASASVVTAARHSHHSILVKPVPVAGVQFAILVPPPTTPIVLFAILKLVVIGVTPPNSVSLVTMLVPSLLHTSKAVHPIGGQQHLSVLILV